MSAPVPHDGKGVTFIYVSHRMEEIKRIGDRATIF